MQQEGGTNFPRRPRLPIAQCQKSSSRMMIGIGIPNSHNRMPLPIDRLLEWFSG